MAIGATRQGLKRGALAKRFGCNIETIRYYENIGLLTAPDRTPTGHRLYTAEDQSRLGFILRARELGFSVEEVRSLAALSQSPDQMCGHVLALTEHHLQNVRMKIRDLARLEHSLLVISKNCAGGDAPLCPVIVALLDEGREPGENG